ncbi:hypothetical protein HK413_02675 [Mucilaginibacter sp. S1162]|uniref:Uncharacterized protein n=1 Tax=Mucilaginibacter humi TaxID=2732510 RepID=A0ABX1VZQ4_9SPHI|nr:hypothetical protein [Mucilaginibacter humi]NNU33340.1 hypothetical protein [Mucilaginibacter humi]
MVVKTGPFGALGVMPVVKMGSFGALGVMPVVRLGTFGALGIIPVVKFLVKHLYISQINKTNSKNR